jgi:hypothetical protein
LRVFSQHFGGFFLLSVLKKRAQFPNCVMTRAPTTLISVVAMTI